MNIRNLGKSLALSATLLTACERGPIHRIAEKEAPQTAHVIDSLKTVSQSVLKDKTLHCYGRDTLEISTDIVEKPGKFVKSLNISAKTNMPNIVTGCYTTYMPVMCGKSITLAPKKNDIHTDLFINPKTVIKDGIYANEKGNKLYVPVEFYGQPNPDPALGKTIK